MGLLVIAGLVWGGIEYFDPGNHTPTQAEQIYALAVQTNDPADFGSNADLSNGMVNTLASEGHSICSDLQGGETVSGEIAKVELGFKPKEAAVLVGAAPALCKDQDSKIKQAGGAG